MKTIALASVGFVMMLCSVGCQTKVYNETPPVGQNTVVHDRPVIVNEHEHEVDRKPDVQNNINVRP